MSARNSTPVVALLLAACTAAAPPPPAAPGENPLLPNCFAVSVDLGTLAVTVAPPTAHDTGPSRRFLGGDEVGLELGSLRTEALGGRTRVLGELTLRNLAAGKQLRAAPSALSPTGTPGLLAAPLAVSAGGTAGLRWNGDGTAGSGAPHDFVAGKSCGAKSFCARWVQLPAPLDAQGSTQARTVDFEVPAEATTVRLLVAVLGRAEAGLATPGSLSGQVRLRSGAAVPQVTLRVVPAGLSAASAADGRFRFAALSPGIQTVVAAAPGCARAEQAAVVGSGQEASAALVLDCDERFGQVSGQVTRSGVGVPGVELSVLPAGAATAVRALTDAVGRYRAQAVPLGATGSGQVFVSRLAPGLKATAAVPYQDLPADGEAVIDFALEALPPPSLYQLTQRWGPVAAGKVTLLSTVDLSQLNSPLRDGVGADRLSGADLTLDYDPTRLRFFSGQSAPGASLDLAVFNGTVPGRVRMVGISVTRPAGVLPLFSVTFDVLPGAATQVTTRTTVVDLLGNVDDARPRIDLQVNEDTLVLP